MRRVFVLLVLALALSACGRHRIATQPEVPLAMPTPPPHVVSPPEPEETAPPAKPDGSAPQRRPNPPQPRSEPRQEPPHPAVPPKPETAPPVTREEPPQQPSTLQTMPPATQAELDKQARSLLNQADRDLKRVNYSSLTSDAKGQYDTARRFIDQAQQALKEQNFVMAQRLADKAATIAAVLVGR